MDIIIPIPDDVKDRIFTAICANYKYQAMLIDLEGKTIENPTTKEQFFVDMVLKLCIEHVKAYECNIASEIAKINASNRVDNEIQLSRK